MILVEKKTESFTLMQYVFYRQFNCTEGKSIHLSVFLLSCLTFLKMVCLLEAGK